jgi:hypothetical protein
MEDVSRRSPGTVCYVAALDTTLRIPSPEPFIEVSLFLTTAAGGLGWLVIQESDDENDYDPAFRLLLEQSDSLKETFQKRSYEYGHLKYELRRAVAYFGDSHLNGHKVTNSILANNDILDIDSAIVDDSRAYLCRSKFLHQRFFSSYVGRVRITFEQLDLLLEDNNSLLDKLQVLHYPFEKNKHITRRDKLVQVQTNLNFLIKDLSDEISVLLSSRLVAHFSEWRLRMGLLYLMEVVFQRPFFVKARSYRHSQTVDEVSEGKYRSLRSSLPLLPLLF